MQLRESIAPEAFSRQSEHFDALDSGNALSAHLRRIVRASVAGRLPANASILELNCGTGLDAFYFASLGHRVLATDASEGMIGRVRLKAAANPAAGVESRVLSYHALDELRGRSFDLVFSNFGGLNCTDDLADVLVKIPPLLNPGGMAILVIMPRICPWELLMVFKGKFRTAFRRLSGRTVARIENIAFPCYYYNPSYVAGHLADQMELADLRGIYITVPPEFFTGFVERYPRLYRLLSRLDSKIGGYFPFNRWCDHYMITLKKKTDR